MFDENKQKNNETRADWDVWSPFTFANACVDSRAKVWPEAKGGRKFSLDVKKSCPEGRAISKIDKVVMAASLLQVNRSFPHKD